MYLVDTNVVSELRRAATGAANESLLRWASSVDSGLLYLSSISLLELEIGVQRLERRDKRQGKVLRAWLSDKVKPAFEGRILSFDERAAERCAPYHVPNPKPDRDSFIAAIAECHKLTIVTRNERDFSAFDLPLLNPWTYKA